MYFIVNRLFSDISVSQGGVATYARCGEIFNNHFTANLPKNLSVKNMVNRLRFGRIMAMSLWPHFFGPLLDNDNIFVLYMKLGRVNIIYNEYN